MNFEVFNDDKIQSYKEEAKKKWGNTAAYKECEEKTAGKTDTEEFIKKHCQVACLDVFEGKETELETEPYDYIIKSPGINCQRWSGC